jgi:hypothetical protein
VKSKMPSITSITRLRVREVRRRCSLVQMRFRKRQGSRKRRPICRLKRSGQEHMYRAMKWMPKGTVERQRRTAKEARGTVKTRSAVRTAEQRAPQSVSLLVQMLPADGRASPTVHYQQMG